MVDNPWDGMPKEIPSQPRWPLEPGSSYDVAPQRPAGAPPSKASPPSEPRAAFAAVVAAALPTARAAAAMTVPQHRALLPRRASQRSRSPCKLLRNGRKGNQ